MLNVYFLKMKGMLKGILYEWSMCYVNGVPEKGFQERILKNCIAHKSSISPRTVDIRN